LWKLTSGFYCTSNPQFWEKSRPVPRAPKQSCSALQNFCSRPWEHMIPTLSSVQDYCVVSASTVNVLFPVQWNVQITYTLQKAVTNIIQKSKWILHNYFSK
jgi:hypothetical protein